MKRGRERPFPSIKTDSFEWVFVDKNRPAEINELRRKYHYASHDLKEILPPLQRPKVVERNGYVFVILLYPIFDPLTRDIRVTEVDLFISPNRLVTVNVDGFKPLARLFRSGTKIHPPSMQGHVTQLVRAVLLDMTTSILPMIVHISNDLDSVESRLFEESEKGLIRELLRIKTNIATIRKALQGHKTVFETLGHILHVRFSDSDGHEAWFESLLLQVRDVWQGLEVEREMADALHETNRSLIDFRTNQIIKTLTIFSVLILPLTLIAGIFGMNVPAMPIVAHSLGFWLLIGLMALCAAAMLIYFRVRKWI